MNKESMNLIKTKQVIFTDIFDTILSRTIAPEYVKKIWCNRIINLYDTSISIIELYKFRNETESLIGLEHQNAGSDYEYSYEEIIKRIHTTYFKNINYKEFLQTSINIEIEIESSVLYVNDEILNKIKSNKKAKKYCVSDMYLSQSMLKAIFKNLKIDTVFDDIFVSCEFYKNKKSGKLYDEIIKKLKLDPKDIVMIGDNIYSDIESAKIRGIDTIHIDSTKKQEVYQEFDSKNNADLVFNNIKRAYTDLNRIDFEEIIFTLYKFTNKLYYSLIRENYDEVIFLSREGEYLKKLFDIYNNKIYGTKIKSHYLKVSRKSTYLPSLKELSKENFSSLLNQYSYITIEEFLKSLNFETEEINDIKKSIISTSTLIKSDEDFTKKIGYFDKSEELKEIKKDSMFKKIYELNRLEQKENFKKYIESITKSKNICLVDIGWNGSIQNNIQRILGETYKIKGYYFGINLRDFSEKDKKFGLCFSNVNKNDEYDLYNENRTIFEIVLGASHGSANKYIVKNGKVEVLLFKKEEEAKIFNEKINPLQQKMLNTYETLCENLINKYYDNNKINKLFNKIHFNMVFKPNKTMINYFNNLYHYENFGVFEITRFINKNKVKLTSWIKENIKFFVKKEKYFYDTFWPIDKLYNLNLTIPKKIYIHSNKKKFKSKKII